MYTCFSVFLYFRLGNSKTISKVIVICSGRYKTLFSISTWIYQTSWLCRTMRKRVTKVLQLSQLALMKSSIRLEYQELHCPSCLHSFISIMILQMKGSTARMTRMWTARIIWAQLFSTWETIVIRCSRSTNVTDCYDWISYRC